MSYILDALKKSQKQRRRGAVPDVLTVQEIVVQERTGLRLWFVIAASLAAGSLLLLGGYVLWRGGEVRKASVSPDREGHARVAPDTPATLHQLPARPGEVQRGNGEPSAAADGAAAGQTRRPAEPGQTAGNAIAAADTHGEGIQARKEVRSDPPELPPAEDRMYRLQELPDRLRRTLPEFAITALMYAGQPASRMVRINGRLMREGEDLPPGVRLEEIAPEGVILRYQGYRFTIPLK